MSRNRLVPMALGVLSALALMAPAAQAHPDDTMGVAACVLQPGSVAGTAGVDGVQEDLNPPLGGGQGGGSWEPTGLLDTDSGYFTFDGPAICSGTDYAANPGHTAPEPIVVGVFEITASGTYNNLFCGTGTANGTANLGDGNGTTINTTFGITFAAGVGQLSIVVIGGQAIGLLNGPDHPNVITGGNGAGVIDILPTEGSCATTGVTGFLVNGAFYASLSGDAG